MAWQEGPTDGKNSDGNLSREGEKAVLMKQCVTTEVTH